MNTTFAAVLAGTLLALAASGANSNHPYRGIPGRNVFNLQPIRPPPPQELPQPVRPLPQKIFITGLYDIGGVPRALVEINEPGKPVHRHIFAAGGELDRLQILQVDVPAGRVRLRLDGSEETLTLQTPKPGVTPPVGLPPIPGLPRPALPIRG